jgi:hypothetical protein
MTNPAEYMFSLTTGSSLAVYLRHPTFALLQNLFGSAIAAPFTAPRTLDPVSFSRRAPRIPLSRGAGAHAR